jgi:5-formyltetrahydrofolate cyclo-ligase
VLEPDPDTAKRLPEDPGGMCIVPALCYDEYGYRLGYGKGYYDRFLSGYSGITVGICYAACVRGSLVYGRYDRPVELLVTERYIKRTVPPTEKVRIKNNWGRNRNG